jgi:hypothetical protein
MLRRLALLSCCVAFALLLGACAHRQIQVLQAPPAAGYRTLGMVSGNGDNEATAMAVVLDQASRIDADAVVVLSTRPLGHQIIITAKAIRWIGPPPGATPVPPEGAGAPPPGPAPNY